MRLIGAGHCGVLEYGWGAFLAALDGRLREREAAMRDMALAVRMGMFADERQFKAFLEA